MVFDLDRNYFFIFVFFYRDFLRGGLLLGVDLDRWFVLSFFKFE